MVVLDWDDSFSLDAFVLTPGPQTTIVRGMITELRPDGVYGTPFLPALFYGQDGKPLQTLSQNLTGTGNQTILTRSGGQPNVPRQDLFWRKISDAPKRAR